jgi:hypothetical protein
VPGSGQVEESGFYSGGVAGYKVNGVDMNQEEYDAYKNEYWRKYYEELDRNKKVLPILCVVNSSNRTWLALLSDEEISLLRKDSKLIVEDYREAVSDGGNAEGNRCGGNGVTPEDGNVLIDEPEIHYEVVTEMPIMDKRVVSYKKIDSTHALYNELSGSINRLIMNKDSLKLFFPNISNEQTDKCFAVSNTTSKLGYYILSHSLNMENTLTFYWIWPGNRDKCIAKWEPIDKELYTPQELATMTDNPPYDPWEFHVMLICDNTGELKRNSLNPDYMNPSLEWVYFYDTQVYEDPNWDCEKEDTSSRGAFF